MNWCGTLEHNRHWKMLGFAMHCSGLAHSLMALREHGVDETPAGPQYRLFQLDNKEREEFAKFAANLRWFLKENYDREHDDAYWEEYGKHKYTDYEFFSFFDRFSDEEVKPHIEAMEKVAAGEPLKDIKPLMDFLNMLSSRAHGIVDDMRGGCF
jgi:hypothetical protein